MAASPGRLVRRRCNRVGPTRGALGPGIGGRGDCAHRPALGGPRRQRPHGPPDRLGGDRLAGAGGGGPRLPPRPGGVAPGERSPAGPPPPLAPPPRPPPLPPRRGPN